MQILALGTVGKVSNIYFYFIYIFFLLLTLTLFFKVFFFSENGNFGNFSGIRDIKVYSFLFIIFSFTHFILFLFILFLQHAVLIHFNIYIYIFVVFPQVWFFSLWRFYICNTNPNIFATIIIIFLFKNKVNNIFPFFDVIILTIII